jgi:hypothetical protein
MRFATLLAVAVSLLPTSALACGMYVPPEHEELLTELFDEIDHAEVAAITPEQLVQATELNQINDTHVETTEITDDSRPHRKLFRRNRND